MARLTAGQLTDRLRLDYRVAAKMRSPVMNVTAYRDVDDLNQRRSPIVSEDEGHLATHYLVDYSIRTLVGPDNYSDRTSVKFDLLANGNYPYTRPGCYVVSSQMPWTPHFRAKLPICIDHDMWEDATGNMLLGHLLVHVAKLLNFDEIPRSEDYGGYTPAAAEYWRTKLNRQPLNPRLAYPVLPDDISSIPHPVFAPVRAEESEGLFFAPSSRFRESEEPAFVPRSRDSLHGADFELASRSASLFMPKSNQSTD